MAQCADFSATDVSGVAGLCRMGAGENQGVITYTDGRVAVTTDHNPGQPDGFYVQPPAGDADRTPVRLQLPEPLISRMRTLQGIEFGNCSATGLGSTISSLGFLQTTYNGSPITWGPEHLREVYRLLGQGNGQSANAFICSDTRNVGRLAVNNDIAHRASLLAAISTLEGSAGSLDSAHREALLQSLRAAAGVPTPTSSFWEFLKYAGGLIGVGLVFGLLVPWISKWFGPRDGGGGHGTGGGGGTGGRTVGNAQGNADAAAAPVATNPPVAAPRVTINPLAAGILAMNGGGQPGAVPGVVVPPAINGATPGVGALPAPIVAVPPVGVAPLPAPVIRVPVGGLVPAL